MRNIKLPPVCTNEPKHGYLFCGDHLGLAKEHGLPVTTKQKAAAETKDGNTVAGPAQVAISSPAEVKTDCVAGSSCADEVRSDCQLSLILVMQVSANCSAQKTTARRRKGFGVGDCLCLSTVAGTFHHLRHCTGKKLHLQAMTLAQLINSFTDRKACRRLYCWF